MPVIIAIILISFVATLVRSTFGFGEALVAVPLFALFIPLHVAVPLAVLMSVLVALIVVVQDHRQIHMQSAKWLIVFALLGIPIGLAVLALKSDYWVKLFLGAMILGYSVYSLQKKNGRRLAGDSRRWLFICGFLSGVLGGAYGINGPPLVVYGNMRQWTAAQFRATLQAYFLPVSLVGILGYGAQGLLTWTIAKYFLICLPVVIPAVFMGRYLNRALQGQAFFKYVYWGLMGIGVLLIMFTLSGSRSSL